MAAAMALVKKGNRVVLEDGPGRSFIENLKNGDRIMLKENRGTFVFDVEAPAVCGSPASGFKWQGRPQKDSGGIL